MPLCTDCRNDAMIVGGADDVYSAELSRPCSRCGWFPGDGRNKSEIHTSPGRGGITRTEVPRNGGGRRDDHPRIWDVNISSDVEWSDEDAQEFIDRLEKYDLPEFQKEYPCPIGGCESRYGSLHSLDRHIEQEHGRGRLAMHKFFMALGRDNV